MAYIADTASVDMNCRICDNARVEGSAILKEVRMADFSVVRDKAKITYSTLVGSAQVSGNAGIFAALIKGSGSVYGNAKLDRVNIHGASSVFGNAKLENLSGISVTLTGSCKFGGNATFKGLNTAEDFVEKYGADKIGFSKFGVTLTDVWDMGN